MFAATVFASSPLRADESTVRGQWAEPSGAVIQIAPCGQRLCATIVALAPGDVRRRDLHNPDPRLRGRLLCGLLIGTDFVQVDARHAEGGRLYDPMSGRTYSGEMVAEGDALKLRGYVGLRLFGRTETWTRPRRAPEPCVG